MNFAIGDKIVVKNVYGSDMELSTITKVTENLVTIEDGRNLVGKI